MAQVRWEVEYLWDQNLTLTQQMSWCDSVRQAQTNVIIQLDDLLGIKELQIENQKEQLVLEREKFDMAECMVDRQRKLRNYFIATTVLMAGFLTLSLL